MKAAMIHHPFAAPALVAGAAVTIVVAALQARGVQPYGATALQDEIARHDSVVCSKLGFEAQTQKFTDCIAALAGVRTHHEGLLVAYSWP